VERYPLHLDRSELGFLLEGVQALLEEAEAELDKTIAEGDALPDTLDEHIDLTTGAGARVASYKSIHQKLLALRG
jgi:hypothetical protein